VLGDRGQRQASPPSATTRAPGATGGATGTSEPATSGAPSTTGAPTTTKAPSTPARRPGQVPPGWKRSEHPGRGFALAVPDSWRVNESKMQVNFRGPDSDWEFFVQSKSPANDLEQAGSVWEDHLRSEFGNDGLRFLSKGFGQYQGKRAYILEYTYQDKGGLVHERDVNVAIGRWGYSLVFHAPDSDWARFQDQIWTGVEWSLSPIG
jgi:hypothetical protein